MTAQITQADRDAAASLWINVDGDAPTPAILDEAERYRQGVYDHTPAVQAFAKHRTDAIADLLELAYQYQSDLRHPPTADSRERRLERIAAVLAKVGAS